ncbi:MAG: hypothetical protein ACRDJU_00010 [Actinomycetota bacterium]
MLFSGNGGTSWSAESTSALTPYPNTPYPVAGAMSCPTAKHCWVTRGATGVAGQAQILQTGNGGKTWAAATLPAPKTRKDRIFLIPAISCATATSCAALGIPASNPGVGGDGVDTAAATEVVLATSGGA